MYGFITSEIHRVPKLAMFFFISLVRFITSEIHRVPKLATYNREKRKCFITSEIHRVPKPTDIQNPSDSGFITSEIHRVPKRDGFLTHILCVLSHQKFTEYQNTFIVYPESAPFYHIRNSQSTKTSNTTAGFYKCLI